MKKQYWVKVETSLTVMYWNCLYHTHVHMSLFQVMNSLSIQGFPIKNTEKTFLKY